MNTIALGYLLIAGMFTLLFVSLWKFLRPATSAPARRSHQVRDGLFLAAGVAPELMRKCPGSVQVWYSALGLTMLMLSVFAALGMALSVYQFTLSKPIATFAGVLWGSLVLAVDRLLVMAINKFEPAWKSWLKAAPRLLLILALSTFVSETLIQWKFATAIDRRLTLHRQALAQQLNRPLLEQQAQQKAGLNDLLEQVRKIDQEQLPNLHQQQIKNVADEQAIVQPGQPGWRTTARTIQDAIVATNERKATLLKEKEKLEKASAQTEADIRQNNDRHKKELEAPPDMLNRAQAIEEICAENAQARKLYWALFLALLLIEMIPVLSKLLMAPTTYDHLLHHQAQEDKTQRRLQDIRQESELRIRREQQEPKEQYVLHITRQIYQELENCQAPGKNAPFSFTQQLRQEIEEDLQHNVAHLSDPISTAKNDYAVTVYLGTPDEADEQNQIIINLALPAADVLGAHLLHALEKMAGRGAFANAQWLQPGCFELLNAQHEIVAPDLPLAAQLTNDTAYVRSFIPL